jgi:hypothetical protein
MILEDSAARSLAQIIPDLRECKAASFDDFTDRENIGITRVGICSLIGVKNGC